MNALQVMDRYWKEVIHLLRSDTKSNRKHLKAKNNTKPD